jgi:hypothetical protein
MCDLEIDILAISNCVLLLSTQEFVMDEEEETLDLDH